MKIEDFSEEAVRKAAEYLDPDRIRAVIIHMGLFMLSFEQLRILVISKPRSFFSDYLEFVDGEIKEHPTERYKEAVISLGTKEDKAFGASLKFLLKQGAISADDEADIFTLLNYRNLVAHEPHKVINIQASAYQPDAVDRVMNHHQNIGKFWAQAEAETDPDFPEAGEAMNGATFLLNYMIAAVTGSGEEPATE